MGESGGEVLGVESKKLEDGGGRMTFVFLDSWRVVKAPLSRHVELLVCGRWDQI